MNCETTVYITDLIFLIALCLFESTEMGILGSRFQLSSQGPEEATEGTSTNRKHNCECKKRKRNAQCDCDSDQEEDDGILDTPRRQVQPVQNRISLSCLCFVLLSFFSVVWFCFYVFLEQEEIKKHIKVHLSDLVSEWGKQWHSYLRSGTGVEPPQSVPLPGKTNTHAEASSKQPVLHSLVWVIIFLHFTVGVFLQHVQRILEGVQHDGNQPGDPRSEHWYWRWESQKTDANWPPLYLYSLADGFVHPCVALQVVFGSLYRDDVLIKPSRVVSILAAACMLQLVSTCKNKSLKGETDICILNDTKS